MSVRLAGATVLAAVEEAVQTPALVLLPLRPRPRVQHRVHGCQIARAQRLCLGLEVGCAQEEVLANDGEPVQDQVVTGGRGHQQAFLRGKEGIWLAGRVCKPGLAQEGGAEAGVVLKICVNTAALEGRAYTVTACRRISVVAAEAVKVRFPAARAAA